MIKLTDTQLRWIEIKSKASNALLAKQMTVNKLAVDKMITKLVVKL
jgi:hypothetical protein